MKHGGCITIVDDSGNVVYERELTADEMIAEILRKPEEATLEEVDSAVEEVKKETAAPAKKNAKVCKTCGKPGHMQKTCPQQRIVDRDMAPDPVAGAYLKEQVAPAENVPETAPPGSHEVVNMSPMSKQNFEVLKEMQLEGQDVSEIAREISWENHADIEVALKSNNYLAYTFDRKKVIAEQMRSKK